MFCKKCGAEINENSAFCKKCGKPVTITYGISNDVQSSDVDNQHPKERFKGLAIAGFVLGIIGVFLFPILGLLSLVFGIIALANNPREKGKMTKAIWRYKNKARGFGVSSLTFGIICTIFLIISIVLSGLSASFSPFNFNFGSKIDEASCKSIVQEHMREIHDASTQPLYDEINIDENLDEVQVALNDNGATISFKGVRMFDGISLELPNTIQLNKKGEVVSCEWCEQGIYCDKDNNTSTNHEHNSSTDEQLPSQNLNHSSDPLYNWTCPRCGRTLDDGETCDCTWCDICNAWMGGHGHEEGEQPVDSNSSESRNDSNSAQNGTGSTADFDYSFEGNKITITRYKGSGGAVVIPATINGKRVTKIGNGAFDTGINDNIKSVIIPNGVTEIGQRAFRFCHGLTSITIPKSVTSIGDLAFDETNISSVYFEGNAPTGTGFAFYNPNHGATIYYKPGTTGWDNKIWSDFPKETW